MRVKKTDKEMFVMSPLLKKAVALLSFGTFLEYADLMLYVHMGTLLNELFFDNTDPNSVKLLTAAGIFITFGFRPIGAWIFGKIGDNFGRTIVLYITTTIMAISCILIANLPTYAQIGIATSWLVTICRILQSVSSVGEVISCDLYLIETSKPPIQYPLSMITCLFGSLGGTFALGIASLVTTKGFDWRLAFWVGGIIAMIGMQARKTLIESSEFNNIQNKIKLIQEKFFLTRKEAKKIILKEENRGSSKKTSFFLFLIQCAYPLYYYFSYIYCGELFKEKFNYSSEEVIFHNLFLSLSEVGKTILMMVISYYVNPLKILKVQLLISSILVLISFIALNSITESYHLSIIQYAILLGSIHGAPAFPIFYKHIPVLKRFTSAGFQYSLGRAGMFGVTAFGLIYLVEWWGNWGIFGLFAVTLFAYTIALFYFDKLEKESNV